MLCSKQPLTNTEMPAKSQASLWEVPGLLPLLLVQLWLGFLGC